VKSERIDHFADLASGRLLVVGDVMLDCTIRGTVKRVSPEAPVPVLESTYTVYGAGGAANVAANARQLGAAVDVVGNVGAGAEGGRLRRILRIRTPDALIAATALEHGLTLVTRNVRDFAGVPGLSARSSVREA